MKPRYSIKTRLDRTMVEEIRDAFLLLAFGIGLIFICYQIWTWFGSPIG